MKKSKIKKRVGIPKRNIKGLKKHIPQKKKDENKTWNCAIPNATTFTFVNDYGRVSINAIIHDELNFLNLKCYIFNLHVLDSE